VQPSFLFKSSSQTQEIKDKKRRRGEDCLPDFFFYRVSKPDLFCFDLIDKFVAQAHKKKRTDIFYKNIIN